MTWQEIQMELLRSITPLAVGLRRRIVSPAQSDEHHEARIQSVEIHKEAIDAACMQFARGDGWPKLPLAQADLVLLRIRAASEIVSLMSGELRDLAVGNTEAVPAFLPSPAANRQQIFEWLFLDYWQRIAMPAWAASQDTLFSGPLPPLVEPDSEDKP